MGDFVVVTTDIYDELFIINKTRGYILLVDAEDDPAVYHFKNKQQYYGIVKDFAECYEDGGNEMPKELEQWFKDNEPEFKE